MEADKLELISRNIFDSTDKMRTTQKAQLIGVKLADDNSISCEKITDYGDIYQMLQLSTHHADKLGEYDLVAVLTAGWAAPNKDDESDNVAPSEHPERRRVKLALIGYTANQTSSIIAFDGDPEYIYASGEGNGSGALQETFEEFLNGIGW